MISRICRLLVSSVSLLAIFASAEAKEIWLRGAFAFFEKSPEAHVSEIDTDRVIEFIEDGPAYSHGLIEMDGGLGATVHFMASNQVETRFEGPGKLSVERIEERIKSGDEGDETYVQTQMIMSLRLGLVVVDSRALGGNSLLLLETPVGRVTVASGLWLIEIEHNERNQNFNLRLECLEGQLRLTDRRGQNYYVTAGRRLTGAGASETLSIEITAMTEDAREHFESFSKASQSYVNSYSADTLKAYMQPLREVNQLTMPMSSGGEQNTMNTRPVIIEYAPRVGTMTPYKGVLKDVTDYEADLF